MNLSTLSDEIENIFKEIERVEKEKVKASQFNNGLKLDVYIDDVSSMMKAKARLEGIKTALLSMIGELDDKIYKVKMRMADNIGKRYGDVLIELENFKSEIQACLDKLNSPHVGNDALKPIGEHDASGVSDGDRPLNSQLCKNCGRTAEQEKTDSAMGRNLCNKFEPQTDKENHGSQVLDSHESSEGEK
jgi:hypothetical protein